MRTNQSFQQSPSKASMPCITERFPEPGIHVPGIGPRKNMRILASRSGPNDRGFRVYIIYHHLPHLLCAICGASWHFSKRSMRYLEGGRASYLIPLLPPGKPKRIARRPFEALPKMAKFHSRYHMTTTQKARVG